MQINKLNDAKIIPIPVEQPDVKKVLGYKLFPEPYGNIFLCAKKKSGKSTVIYNILKNCVGKDTKVLLISSTVDKDSVYKHIREYLDKKNINYETFTSMLDESYNNVISTLLDQLRAEAKKDQNPKEDTPKPQIIRVDSPVQDEPKKRKSSKIAPEYIIVLDDLGNELKSKTVDQLLKTNRHYKMKVIISSQYLNDLSIQARKQLDYVCVFRGINDDKLEILHKDVDLSIPFEDFQRLYYEATKEKYCFLYIDVRQEAFRVCFDRSISL